MSAQTTSAKPSPPVTLTSGQLPRWIEPVALVAVAAVIAAVLLLLARDLNIGVWLFLTAIAYLVVIGVGSSIVENRRKATDRVVRGLVICAFVLAVIPLVSTLVTVVVQGAAVLDWSFIFSVGGNQFNQDTLEVTNTPGAWQAVVGTLIITGIATVISVPIGILTAVIGAPFFLWLLLRRERGVALA